MAGQCDYCGNGLSEKDYMTECGHILCGSVCYNKYKEMCPICKKTCKFIVIGEKIPKHGTGFLTSTQNLINDAENVINFQFSALFDLISYLRSKISKQRIFLEQVKVELNQVKYFKHEIYELRKENEYLKGQLKEAKSIIEHESYDK